MNSIKIYFSYFVGICFTFLFISCSKKDEFKGSGNANHGQAFIPWKKSPVAKKIDDGDTIVFRQKALGEVKYRFISERKRRIPLSFRFFGKLPQVQGKNITPAKNTVRFNKKKFLPSVTKAEIPSLKENNSLVISSMGRKQGLPTGKITCVVEDKYHQVWVGTSSFGLIRYDGVYLYFYNTNNGFPSNDIQTLFLDKKGNLWIGTTGNGLILYDGYEFYHSNTSLGLSDDVITSFYEDKSGHIWYSTNDNGVAMFSKDNSQILILNSENAFDSDNFRSIVQGKDGKMWFCSAGSGLYCYDFNQIKNYSESDIPENIILSSATDAYGNLWFGADSKGVFYITENNEIYHADKSSGLSDNSVTFLASNGGSSMIAGTFEGGINIIEENKINLPLTKNHGLLSNRISFVHASGKNLFWIAGTEGLNLVNTELAEFFDENDGIRFPYIKDIASYNENIWLASYGYGLLLYRNDSLFKADIKNLLSDKLLSIESDRNGQIWFSTESGGLYKIQKNILYQLESDILEEYPVFCLAHHGEHLWMGTDGNGLIQWKEDKNLGVRYLYRDGLSGNIVHNLISLDGNSLLVCTDETGFSLIRNDSIISVNDEENGFGSKKINDAVLRKNTLYLGTEGNGLFCIQNFNAVSQWKQCLMGREKYPTHIRNLMLDADYLLVFASNGFYVYKFSDTISDLISIYQLDQKTGLNNPEFVVHSLFKNNYRDIFSSTSGQLVKINRASYIRKNIPDTPVISNIRINDEKIDFLFYHDSTVQQNEYWSEVKYSGSLSRIFHIPEKIILPYNIRRISIDVSAEKWNMLFHEADLYYSLEKDKTNNWIHSDNDFSINLNNLSPGEYMLSVQIRYYNNSITRENALRIVILPPWWKTWWAQILFIILGAGIIWGLMQFRTRQLVKQKLQLEQIVKERTREIEEQKNLIEEKNRDILDSINYTRRLQRSSLPGEKDVKEIFSDSFILYMPRDIISGDFYFVSNIRTNDGKILRCAVAGDCTGHGVPGAFLSILLLAYIKQSMGERDVNSPAEALQFVTEKMKKVMEYRLEESLVKDSADMSFMVIYPDGRMIASCANNPIYIVRDNSLIEIPAVKRPVGYSENELPFENHEFITRPGDMIYMFSDGYADQFGLNESTKNKEKKFTKKRFKDLLIQISALPVAEQYNILLNKHQEWKGKLDQTDDILVIGIRI